MTAETVPLNVLLVDDEPLARLRLRTLLGDLAEPATRVCGEAGDTDAALALLQAMAVDVLLLDIQLPGRNGLALAQALQALPQPPAVVFVTAHAEHALQAFELAAVDYLTKPVKRERLQAALQRVAQRRRAVPVAVPAETPVLVVHDRGRVLRLPLAEVLYLKAELKYVTLRTPGQAYVLDDSLTDLAQRLEALGAGFLRVHRNALVARHAVRALEFRLAEAGANAAEAEEGWAVQVAPLGEWLAVSRRQLTAVREALATQ